MYKPPTIRDVAAAAGVSVSVVSRVLNPEAGPVAPATRERVTQVIEELGYHPRAAARDLNAGRTQALGLVLADLANPFFARLADQIVREARTHDLQVVLMTTQEDPYLEADALDTLLDRSVGAVIATPTGGNLDRWRRLQRLGVGVVFVDRTVDDLLEVDVVSIANADSADQATEYLITLGHRRIALISGPRSTSTGRSRIEGYRRALERSGVAFEPQLVRDVPFRGDGGSDAVGSLLALPDAPTALIVANTAQVRNAVRRLKQVSVDIPEKLSLIVFDDNPWTELVDPPLTAVRQPIEMLATHSVQLALDRLHLRATGPRLVEVTADFMPRSSCSPLLSPTRRG